MSGPAWSTINPGLISLFTALALPDPNVPQVPAWLAEWRDRARKGAPTGGPLKGVTLTLKINNIGRVGRDEQRVVYFPPNVPPAAPTPWDDSLQESIYGLRRVTLNLQANMSEVSDGSWAAGLLESIATRLGRSTSIDTLLALNIGIISIGAVQDLSFRQTQHTQSRASLDVMLTMVASDIDPVPTGWIKTLDISSLIQDVSGATLPVPPNFNHLRVTAP